MAKQSSGKKKTAKGTTSTVTKGRMVERIVALMHDQPGVTVERNRFLLPVSGEGRKREIDVLLTCAVSGYPVQMAIECKNEKTPIDSPKIDAFVGKLQHVGIPPQYGIYISASGYTNDAIKRAKAAGMRTLTLRGLSDYSASTMKMENLRFYYPTSFGRCGTLDSFPTRLVNRKWICRFHQICTRG